jgi:hypothetical protein
MTARECLEMLWLSCGGDATGNGWLVLVERLYGEDFAFNKAYLLQHWVGHLWRNDQSINTDTCRDVDSAYQLTEAEAAEFYKRLGELKENMTILNKGKKWTPINRS